MKKTARIVSAILLLLGGLALALVSTPRPAYAATINVTGLLDNISGNNGGCTLREAIRNANLTAGGDVSGGDCTAGSAGVDTIVLAAGTTYTLTRQPVPPESDDNLAANGDLDILDSVIIQGNGAIIEVQGGANFRLFHVNDELVANLSVIFQDVTIQNGSGGVVGGGIYNQGGSVTITDTTLQNNQADFGAGVYNGNSGTLAVTGSTFLNNTANDAGGGVYNGNGSNATVTNSTFSDNTAGEGGALRNVTGATVSSTNNTFNENDTSGVTSGTFDNSGTLNLANTILANTTGAGADCTSDVALNTDTNNLIENNDGCGTPLSTADPQLGPLALNDGTTQNYEPVDQNSPVVDAGNNTPANNAGLTTDQRGVNRFLVGTSGATGGTVDIGSVEYRLPPGIIEITKSADPQDGTDFGFTGTNGVSTTFTLDDAIPDDGDTFTDILTFEVLPGAHSAREVIPVGWELTDLTCTDPTNNTVADLATATASIDVASGETVSCTFTNVQYGSITVTKDADFADGTNFDFTTTGGLGAFTLDDAVPDDGDAVTETITFDNILPVAGGYDIVETVPAGWSLDTASCTGGTSTSVTNGVNVDLAAGEDVTCTFSNVVDLGSITIIKDAAPEDGTDFDFNGTGGLGAFALDDDADATLPNTETFTDLQPGTYDVTETVPADWTLDSVVCNITDGGTGAGSTSDITNGTSIELAPGDDVTCTFTNNKQATITIIKDTQPDDDTDFNFTGTGGISPTFTLDDDGGSDLTYNNSVTFQVAGGTQYTVTENDPGPAWQLDAASSCTVTTGTGSASLNSTTRTATLNPDAGDVIECTFQNVEAPGEIVIIKEATPESTQVFDFTSSIPANLTFSLTDDGTAANTQTFSNLSTGIYTVAETLPTGWLLNSLSCDDPGGGTTTAGTEASIDLAPGETVTCTYTNLSEADLAISKTAAPDPVVAGASLTYTVRVTNTGSGPASNVVVSDPLPTNLSFESSTCGATETGGTVTWNVNGGGILGANITRICDIVVTVSPNAISNVSNNISVTADTSDPDTSNNSDSVTTAVTREADLAITKSDSPDPAVVGGTLIYTLQVTNSGPSSAQSVVISDTLPLSLSYNSNTCGATVSGNLLTWTIPNLEPGSNTCEITTTVNSGTEGAVINNTATVTTTTTETTPDNNSASTTTTVSSVTADVELSKSASASTVERGQTLSYTLNVQNIGPDLATGVVVSDTLPMSLTYVSDTCSGSVAGNIWTWNVGDVATGSPQSCTLETTVDADASGTLTNNASVSATSGDPDPTNNSDSVDVVVDVGVDVGSITIIKAADPADGTDYSFTGTGDIGSFTLDDANPDDGDTVSNSATFDNLAVGDYDITESVPAGQALNVSCTGGSFVNIDDGVRVSLGADETVTCTFTNTVISAENGTLQVVKQVNWGDTPVDNTQTFEICVTGPSYQTPECRTSSATGGTLIWANIQPGTYQVTETDPGANWIVDGAPAEAQVTAGETTSITVTNTFMAEPTPERIYLPFIARPVPPAPDLVITDFRITSATNEVVAGSNGDKSFAAGEAVTFSVTVENQGQVPTQRGFWVDLFIDPEPIPTAPSVRWDLTCPDNAGPETPCYYGVVWLVNTVLDPGESVTLTSNSIATEFSRWPGYLVNGASDIYVLADSWNPGVDTGAVVESDEQNNRAEILDLSVTGDNPFSLLTQEFNQIPERPAPPELSR